MVFTKMSKKQKIVCAEYNAPYKEINENDIIGVGGGIEEGIMPINGLRHPTSNGQTGWFIWGGKYSDNDDFFKPMHAMHLVEMHPEIAPYLGLDQGWRFLIDPTKKYEDAWQDNSLLEV